MIAADHELALQLAAGEEGLGGAPGLDVLDADRVPPRLPGGAVRLEVITPPALSSRPAAPGVRDPGDALRRSRRRTTLACNAARCMERVWPASKRRYLTLHSTINPCLGFFVSLLLLVAGAVHLPFVLVPTLITGVVASPLTVVALALPAGWGMTMTFLSSPRLGPYIKGLGAVLILPTAVVAAGIAVVVTAVGAVVVPIFVMAMYLAGDGQLGLAAILHVAAASCNYLWAPPPLLAALYTAVDDLRAPLGAGETPYDIRLVSVIGRLLLAVIGTPCVLVILAPPAVLAAPFIALNVLKELLLKLTRSSCSIVCMCGPFIIVGLVLLPALVLALIPVAATLYAIGLPYVAIWKHDTLAAILDYVVDGCHDMLELLWSTTHKRL